MSPRRTPQRLAPSIALAAVLALFAAAPAGAAATWRSKVTIVASDRLRWESVDWFAPPVGAAPPGAATHDFFANQLRLGLRGTLPHAQLYVEAQDVRLVHLPDDASLAAPYGNLGPGANYYFFERERDPGETILRQAVLTVRSGSASAALGRFEQADGLETQPADADLLWLKKARIAERLLGPFGFSHVGRTVDGLRLVVDRPAWNATALGVRPTAGGFEVSGGEELDEVTLLGASVTGKKLLAATPADARAFFFRYDDERVEDGVPVRVDNRPLATRQGDRGAIRVNTWGGHAATIVDAGAAHIDALAWGALQTGAWGAQDHRAWAGALEVGAHWPHGPGSPWLRAGLDVASGDDDPADGRHGTFLQLLPTPRIYALFPFFNLMNVEDRFVQLVVKPHPKVLVRADYHALRLESSADLWYGGGGAIRQDVFGFSGTPANGQRDLAHLLDVSVTANPHRRVTIAGYLGHAAGEDVVGATFAGDADATYGFLETTLRW